MRYEYVTTQVEHLKSIIPQAKQMEESRFLDTVDWERYWETGFAITCLRDGQPIAIGGIRCMMEGIGEAWLLLSNEVGPMQMAPLGRQIARFIDSEMQTGYYRIQAYVKSDFVQAVRFARLMKFKTEGIMRDFPCKGKDSLLLARTR